MNADVLIVTGAEDRQWPRSKYDDLPDLPRTPEHLSVEGASHWGLVLSRRALAVLVPQVVDWIGQRT
ncbi:MAG: hypothetical protein HY873_03320 [Chloroflexi bacterium]|nr:hypothetical protein [Chloroflexota bacterium]